MKTRAFSLPALLAPGLVLLLIGAAVFQQFLFGDSVLLYKDIGSDSLLSYYPDFVHLSGYIRTEGYPSWSFHIGMGQDLAYATGFLIWQPVTWLPQASIASALVFQHLAKILLAGLLFYRFLQLLRLRTPAPLLGALLLSFSAYMCMGSCWYPLADEVVAFAALLLGVEEALQRGRWLLLSVVVALVGMINPFFLYLTALFLLAYVSLRLFSQLGWQPVVILRRALPLVAVAFLGLGLGALITLPYLDAVLKSPRGAGATSVSASLTALPVFGFAEPRQYFTTILRSYSNDLIGTAADFRGWQNYLEAPLNYCGLLPLLLFPQVILSSRRRNRIVLLLFLGAVLIPTVLPWFRYLFWLFEGDYYRTYSLFWVIGLILLSAVALSRYSEGRSFNLPVLLLSAALLVAILFLPGRVLGIALEPRLKSMATLYLLLYAAILVAGHLLKQLKVAAWLLVGLAAIELVQFNHITVSNRQTVLKSELRAHQGYNDETVEAIRDLKADDRGFFRLSKPHSSAPTVWLSLNDAMVFGYYGTGSYSSFNNSNYIAFLSAMNAIDGKSEAATRWSIGLLGDPLLSTFACEKYRLVDDPATYEGASQYTFVRHYGRQALIRNQLFLPLGLTFTRSIPEDSFARLSTNQKAEALFRVVVSSGPKLDAIGLPALTVAELESEIAERPLPEVLTARRESALKLTSFHQARIEGTLRLDQHAVLVLQTPFDYGWHAFSNGKAMPTFKVDSGLLGIGLDAGDQKLELRYRNPMLAPGIAVSSVSLCLLLLGLWKWPRLHAVPL